MNELMLLSTMRMVREPGIFEPIAIVLGKIYNMLFNGIYGSVSAGALGIAIIIFTLIVKLILFPLMMKQQKSSFKMQTPCLSREWRWNCRTSRRKTAYTLWAAACLC